jgi:hypothetical protein
MKAPFSLYIDMDGVTVDWFRGFRELSGKSWDDPYWKTHGGKETKEKLIAGHPNWWANLPPERDFDQLWGFVKNFNPHILTAYAEWDEANCKHGKVIWNQKHTKVPHERFHCVLRESKKYFAKDHDGSHFGRPNVLVDDYPENIKEWEQAGGIGILHTSASTSIARLKELGFSTK